jgi:(E)-4-hydroxy-3-methylbut-2-enyl-diphosphate synthase
VDSESFNRSQNKDFSSVPRNNTRRITLGSVAVGGGAPVSVQTMTNTDTRDVASTVSCIKETADAGCDIVRIAVPDAEAAAALSEIRKQTGDIPLVADIHFDWRLAMLSLDAGVDGLRINPGNIGGEEKVRSVAKAANDRNVPIRIGVNGGSLEPELLQQYGGATPEALVDSALRHVTILENADFGNIKISVKASDVHRTVAAYRLLSSRTCYPLHLGLTEAGTFLAGTVRSSVAMGILLSEGIGDTVRISLTDTPLKEVIAGQEILRCLSLRAPGPNVTSCPTCGRTQADVINTAIAVEAALEKLYREEPAIARPHVAVMGCVVNGPGEARDADIALVGGNNFFYLYIRGERVLKVSEEEAVRAVVEAVREYK